MDRAQLAFDFEVARRDLAALSSVVPEPLVHDDLDEPSNEFAIGEVLGDRLGQTVIVTLTDNRRTMISAKRSPGRIELRLHRMFLYADEIVLIALAAYLRDRHVKVASKTLDDFISRHKHSIRKERRSLRRVAQGKYFDLRAMFVQLEGEYFAEPVTAEISWGRRVAPRRGQRSIQLGTYVPDEKLIRIHPLLDQDWVPDYFVASVVYHEMLHHVLPATVSNGRHRFHTKEFRQLEAAFAHHERALAWESKHLRKLLRSKLA